MKTFFLLICTLLAACAPMSTTPAPISLPSTSSEAQDVLIRFFELLSAKQYAEADLLYGGDYEQLKIFNSTADPADHAALWSWSCENAGLQCLKVRSAIFLMVEGDTYDFQVEFSNPDGSLFVPGPCCGAEATEMPPVSQYEYHVTHLVGGNFRVLDLPPYVP